MPTKPFFRSRRQYGAIAQRPLLMMLTCAYLLVVGCEEPSRWDDVHIETLPAAALLELAVDQDAPALRLHSHTDMHDRLRASAEKEEMDPEISLIIETVTTEWLDHDHCDVRADGWQQLRWWLYTLTADEADETARRRGLATLRALAVEAGRSITNPTPCVLENVERGAHLMSSGCWLDDRLWDDSLSNAEKLSPRSCIQLEVASFLRDLGPHLDDHELVEPLVHLALAAEDPAVRGRVLSLLYRRVLPRGADLIEVASRRLASDPHPDVRERVREWFDPSVRFTHAIPIELGDMVEGRIETRGPRRPPPSKEHPIYELVLEEETRVVVELVGLEDFDPELLIVDESGGFLASDDDSGGGGDGRVVLHATPGRYYLYPTSYDGRPGGFRISTRVP